MQSQGPVSARALVLALALGAVPAGLALWLQPGLLDATDLPAAGAGAGAVLILALLLRRRAWPERGDRACLLVALLLAALPPIFAALRLDGPATNDERSYLFQAALFTEGRVSEPLPPLAEAWSRRQVLDDAERGIRYSKYPPGTSLGLAPALAAGFVHLTPLLAGLLDVVLAAAIARRLGLRRPGLLALLLAASPFFLLTQSSLQSEVFTAPAVLGGYLALLRVRADGVGHRSAAGWGALAGACAGWVFLCRPLTGVLLAAAVGWGFIRSARRAPALCGAVAAGLPFAVGFLLYNAALTGSVWRLPYHLYALQNGPFSAQGAPLDVYGKGDFGAGLLNQAGAWSVACAGILGAAALGFWGLWRLRARDAGAGLLFAVAGPLAYSLHWYAGAGEYLGPLYCFESLPLLLLGALTLLRAAPAGARRGFVAASLLAGPIAAGLRWERIAFESARRAAPERAAAAAPPGAVIFLLPVGGSRMDDPSAKFWTPSRPPRQPQDRVILRAIPSITPAEMLQQTGLSGRPAFRYVPDDRGVGGSLKELR